jgi:hypothetical protein
MAEKEALSNPPTTENGFGSDYDKDKEILDKKEDEKY